MIESYLQQLHEAAPQMPAVLFHAADRLTKILKPRVTGLFGSGSKDHKRKAIFASHNKLYAFGLERPNLMIPNKHTKKEVDSWTKACWLKPDPPRLIVWYWNYIPKKPFYLYHLDSNGFKPFKVTTPKHTTYHWYIEKDVVPLKMDKIPPTKVKNIAWKIATDKQWEEKKSKYKVGGYYK